MALLDALPSSNPLAGISIMQRSGLQNPVKGNTIRDVRGEPQALRQTVITTEPAFLKDPRLMDAYLDKAELKDMVPHRTIGFL